MDSNIALENLKSARLTLDKASFYINTIDCECDDMFLCPPCEWRELLRELKESIDIAIKHEC